MNPTHRLSSPFSRTCSLAALLAFPVALFASANPPGETVFTFDTPSDALALEETVSGAPMTIYLPSPAGGLGNSGSLQWQSGNRVAVRHATSLRVHGARPITLSIAFRVSAAEAGGGQPLALGVRATAQAASEFGRSAVAGNAGFRLGIQTVDANGNYRLLLANLPAGAGEQTLGGIHLLQPNGWYRLELECTPTGKQKVDLVGRLVGLDAQGKPANVIDEVEISGVANADVLTNTQLVPWFGGQSGALRGIVTVDNFSVSNK